MSRKPNWKRKGLQGPVTEEQRKVAIRTRLFEQKVAMLPGDMRENKELVKLLQQRPYLLD